MANEPYINFSDFRSSMAVRITYPAFNAHNEPITKSTELTVYNKTIDEAFITARRWFHHYYPGIVIISMAASNV